MRPHNHCDFSPDRRHRYTLWRVWNELAGADARFLQCIGLNPSTADEQRDDPTIRRVIRFAKEWGFDGLCMTNLFAFRATDPREMKKQRDAAGPFNDQFLADVGRDAGLILCAWGTHGSHLSRAVEVVLLLKAAGLEEKLHCLKLTADGFPSHPLYIPADTKPKRYVTPGISP